MAQYTDEELDEFACLYEAEFGRPITRAEALEMATRLITLYSILVRPLPERPKSVTPSAEDQSRPYVVQGGDQ